MRVPQSNQPHSSVEPEQSAWLTDGELTDGEVTVGSVTDVLLPTPLRTHWYLWLARQIIGATSLASIMAWHVQASAATTSASPSGALGLG